MITSLYSKTITCIPKIHKNQFNPFNLLDNEKNNRKKATNEPIDQAACAYDIDGTNITKRTKRNLIKMAESSTSTLETTTRKDVRSLSVIEESIEATNAPNIEKDQKYFYPWR